MRRAQWAATVLAAAALALTAWMFRWQIVGDREAMYLLDRWTGNVVWLLGEKAEPVKSTTFGFDDAVGARK